MAAGRSAPPASPAPPRSRTPRARCSGVQHAASRTWPDRPHLAPSRHSGPTTRHRELHGALGDRRRRPVTSTSAVLKAWPWHRLLLHGRRHQPGGNSGPASAAVHVTTWSPPGRVTNLAVTGGDDQLAIKWGAASVPARQPRRDAGTGRRSDGAVPPSRRRAPRHQVGTGVDQRDRDGVRGQPVGNGLCDAGQRDGLGPGWHRGSATTP